MRRPCLLPALLAIGCGLAAASLGWAPAAGSSVLPGVPQPQARTLADGVYTQEQAQRGDRIYRQHCIECHQTDEYRGFLRRWVGLPVSFFYETVRSAMPENNPGGLSRDEYADVLTYIFSINDAPTGDEEMSSEPEALDAITITVPADGDGDADARP